MQYSVYFWNGWQHAQKCKLLGMTTKVKNSKSRKINFFDFPFMDIDGTKVGEVEGRVQKGSGMGSK